MPTFKNIRIKMKGGKTRMQRVKVLASGKYKFVKNITKSKSKSTQKVKKTKSKNSKRGNKKMGNGKRKFTIPLAPVAGIVAVVAKPAQMAIDGDYEGAAAELGARIVGYNFQSGEMDLMYAAKNGWGPLIFGGLVHKFVGGTLGVNRMLGQAGVPIIRI